MCFGCTILTKNIKIALVNNRKMNIRKPAVAGQFYPGTAKDLSEMLGNLFASAHKDELLDDIPVNALIAPHAGYVFSGKQAAKAYQYLKKGNYTLVCVISPSHQEYFEGVSIYPGEAYKTPLGDCPVHSEARELALSCENISSDMKGHRREHALEVQLPFIQHKLGNIPILPLVMGDQSKRSIDLLSSCLGKLYGTYGNKILFVASSDLSHFHSAEHASMLDGHFIELLDKAELGTLYDKLHDDELEACGGGPILAIMKGLNISGSEIKILGYSHSGEVLEDKSSVVGYTSAIMIKGY